MVILADWIRSWIRRIGRESKSVGSFKHRDFGENSQKEAQQVLGAEVLTEHPQGINELIALFFVCRPECVGESC